MRRVWTVVCGATLVLAGCTRQAPDPVTPTAEAPAAATAAPVVMATIFPIADIAAQLAGDAARVEPLLPPGASPHTFELTPVQAALLSSAAAVIQIGPGIDTWVTSQVPAGSKVLTLSEQTELLGGFHHEHAADEHDGHAANPEHEEPGAPAGDRDPHVWLDPLRMRDDLAPAIATLLTDLVPQEKDAIQQRLVSLQADLTALDQELTAVLAPAKDAAYITAHPAWGYFDQRYHLNMAAVIEETPGKEPSGQRLGELVKEARSLNVRAVMAEKQQNKALAERLSTDLGVKLGVLDPLGGQNIAGCDSYRALLLHNAREFAKVLTP